MLLPLTRLRQLRPHITPSEPPATKTNKQTKQMKHHFPVLIVFFLKSINRANGLRISTLPHPRLTETKKTSHFILHLNAKRQINIWRIVASAAMRVCFIW